jgi:FixJ family two-component response regulator
VKNGDAVVFVVDDDESMRESLSNLIRSVGLRAHVFASAREFLVHPRPDAPACLVLDVCLPGLSGLELQGELHRSGRSMPIIFITGQGDIPMTVRAMKAGAVEFLSKPLRADDLIDAIRAALNRSACERHETEERSDLRGRYESLSAREREVLVPVVRGMLNKQVAAALGISEATVKVHRRHIIEKLRAQSLAEMVVMAQKLDLIAKP